MRAEPPVPGAIFTTDSTCNGVDLNIYGDKHEVYLDGGPAHPGAASLPPGDYYVQATDPSGACVLGTSVPNRPFHVNADGSVPCIQLCQVLTNGDGACAANGVDPNCGYNDTTNPGGEYKVWVSNVDTFDNSSTKTDNFKVRGGGGPPPETATLCVLKFYDANANGVFDGGEQQIQGWQYQVFADDNLIIQAETYHCSVVDPGTYHVIEGTPLENNWIHTTATKVDITLAGTDTQTAEFGNVCLGAGGGLTLGYWSNKNGQRETTSADLTYLSGLCLRNANGSDFNPSTTSALSTWLLNATAVNMAYMLSAQLAAMELNVRHHHVNSNALVYGGDCVKSYQQSGQLPGSNGFITIGALMAAAETELCAHGYTPSGSPYRAYQECVKTTLDKANNNINFVESSPCPFTFAPFLP
jgi:hypothetical protein